MCSIEMTEEHDKENSKEHQLKHILSENMRMLDDSEDVDKYGHWLEVESDDDDALHNEHHKAFISNNKLRPQMKSMMESHIKKHDIQIKEKERMGLGEKKSEEEPKSKPKVAYANEPY